MPWVSLRITAEFSVDLKSSFTYHCGSQCTRRQDIPLPQSTDTQAHEKISREATDKERLNGERFEVRARLS